MTDPERQRPDALPAAGADRAGFPPSPCVDVCTLDEEDRCVGCGRSLEQIARWTGMTRREQWAVIDELAARRAVNTGTIAPGDGGRT